MTLLGHVRNGVVIPDGQVKLPEGAQVRIEIIGAVKSLTPAAQEPDSAVAARFHQLADEWRNAVRPLSSLTRMVQHPAYQAIIALGPPVVPLLLKELEQQPDHWFAALKALTGATPVPPEDAGQLDRMAAAWIRWGKQHGHI